MNCYFQKYKAVDVSEPLNAFSLLLEKYVELKGTTTAIMTTTLSTPSCQPHVLM